MKKIFTIFFVLLGIIFFILILLVTYLFVFDPLNIKPIIFGSAQTKTSASIDEDKSDLIIATTTKVLEDSKYQIGDKTTNLSSAQEDALEAVGVEPESIPQNFTAEQLSCFESVLGKQRVDEIKTGSVPSVTEFFKAKSCI